MTSVLANHACKEKDEEESPWAWARVLLEAIAWVKLVAFVKGGGAGWKEALASPPRHTLETAEP